MAVVPVSKVGILAVNVTLVVPEATTVSDAPRTISPESILPSVLVSIQAVKLPVTKPLPVAVMDVPLTPDVGLNDTDRALTLKAVVVPQVLYEVVTNAPVVGIASAPSSSNGTVSVVVVRVIQDVSEVACDVGLVIAARGLKVRKWKSVPDVPLTLASRLCVLAVDGAVSPTVIVTVVLFAPITTVGSNEGFDVPPVVVLVVMVMCSLAIVEGTPQDASNVTNNCPDPATNRVSVVKDICICPDAPAEADDKTISSTSTSALAFEGEKNPKASIVAITPITKSIASPEKIHEH